MQARYYDPVIGRFYSNDPVDAMDHIARGNPIHGFNRYTYANNNPYKYVDPDGKFGQIVAGAFYGGLVGLAVEGAKQFKSGKFDGGNLFKETGKGAFIGAAAATFGMATVITGLGKTLEVTSKVTGLAGGAMVGSGTADMVENAMGGDISISERNDNMIANMAGPGTGKMVKAATSVFVKSTTSQTLVKETSAAITTEVLKDELKGEEH